MADIRSISGDKLRAVLGNYRVSTEIRRKWVGLEPESQLPDIRSISGDKLRAVLGNYWVSTEIRRKLVGLEPESQLPDIRSISMDKLRDCLGKYRVRPKSGVNRSDWNRIVSYRISGPTLGETLTAVLGNYRVST